MENSLIEVEGTAVSKNNIEIDFGGHSSLTRVWNDDDTFSNYVLYVGDCCSFTSVTIKLSQSEGERLWALFNPVS